MKGLVLEATFRRLDSWTPWILVFFNQFILLRCDILYHCVPQFTCCPQKTRHKDWTYFLITLIKGEIWKHADKTSEFILISCCIRLHGILLLHNTSKPIPLQRFITDLHVCIVDKAVDSQFFWHVVTWQTGTFCGAIVNCSSLEAFSSLLKIKNRTVTLSVSRTRFYLTFKQACAEP